MISNILKYPITYNPFKLLSVLKDLNKEQESLKIKYPDYRGYLHKTRRWLASYFLLLIVYIPIFSTCIGLLLKNIFGS